MEQDRDLFERAKRSLSVPDVLSAAGYPRIQDGVRWTELYGDCPICGKRGCRYKNDTFKCWRNPEDGGSVVDLYAAVHSCTPLQAAREIAGKNDAWEGRNKPDAHAASSAAVAQRIEHRVPNPSKDLGGAGSSPAGRANNPPDASHDARIIWRGAMRQRAAEARDLEIVGGYLTARGIPEDVTREAIAGRSLIGYPAAPYRFDNVGQAIERHPAIVALVRCGLADGQPPTGGIHCTYLAPDFQSKAKVKAPKKMWGPQGVVMDPGSTLHLDRAGKALPGGVLLIPPRPGGWLVRAEGIETALSLCAMLRRKTGKHAGAFAALSLNRLQGGMLPKRFCKETKRYVDGFITPNRDPDKPPALWPHKGRVMIGVDNDMSAMFRELKGKRRKSWRAVRPAPLKFRGRWRDKVRLRRWALIVDGEHRARVCGQLAAQWDERFGATEARQAIAPRGEDWNDVIRREWAA